MTPPTEWIDIVFFAEQGRKTTVGLFLVHQNDEHLHNSKICTWLRAGLLMTPPIEWIHFENRTIQVSQLTWVCVCVHTHFYATV